MNESREVSVVLRDFAHDARADVGRFDRWHHENRLETLRQMSVHERHLELVLEIADRAQAADVERRSDLLGEIDQQSLELGDLDTLLVRRGKANQLDSFFGGKEGLFGRVHGDSNDEVIHELAASADQVLVSPGDGIEASSIDG